MTRVFHTHRAHGSKNSIIDALLDEAEALSDQLYEIPPEDRDLKPARLMLLRLLRAATRDQGFEDEIEDFFLMEKEPMMGADVSFFDDAALITRKLHKRPISRLIPDEDLAPLLMVCFQKHLAPLLEPTDDAIVLEDRFVIALSSCIRPSFFSMTEMAMEYESDLQKAEIAANRKKFYLDRCNWVDVLVWSLQGRRHKGPSIEKCLEKLGGEDKLETHVLPWARNDEERELIRRSVGQTKLHKK